MEPVWRDLGFEGILDSMFQCWLIRGVTLTLLTLCAAVWAGSYWLELDVQFSNKMLYCAGLSEGRMCVTRREMVLHNGNPTVSAGWHLELVSAEIGEWSWHDTPIWDLMGFSFFSAADCTVIKIPLWFPTGSFVLLWFLWRKAKKRPLGRGFPIELNADAK